MRLAAVRVGDVVDVEHFGRLVASRRRAVVVWRTPQGAAPDDAAYLRLLQGWLLSGSCDFAHSQIPRYGIVVREDREGRQPRFYAPHPDRLTLVARQGGAS